MRHKCFLFMLFLGVVPPVPAVALTLTNRDQVPQTFTLIEGDKQTEMMIKSGEQLTLCAQGCVIRMADNELYEFEGAEIVGLEDGILFLDTPASLEKKVP